jgi:hypothetical protein
MQRFAFRKAAQFVLRGGDDGGGATDVAEPLSIALAPDLRLAASTAPPSRSLMS